VVSTVGEGNQNTQRKPLTCHTSLTNKLKQIRMYQVYLTMMAMTFLTPVVIDTKCIGKCKFKKKYFGPVKN
jgi:hypothetical protein